MGRMKILCDTSLCRWCKDEVCSFKPSIKNGKCINFTKNLAYYIVQFGASMNGKMLPFYNLTDEVKIGAYYAMKIYKLNMRTKSWGDWKWVEFTGVEDETMKGLDFDVIADRPYDIDEFVRLENLLYEGKLPPFEDELDEINKDKEKKEKKKEEIEANHPNMENYEYGFIDTKGEFYPADFGDHTELAYKIIEDNKEWHEEFWKSEYLGHPVDFLVNVKYWILIHNPWGYGKSHIQTSKIRMPLKAQIDFLYNYFVVRGDYGRANQILQEYSF